MIARTGQRDRLWRVVGKGISCDQDLSRAPDMTSAVSGKSVLAKLQAKLESKRKKLGG